jgi:hypothetical protein
MKSVDKVSSRLPFIPVVILFLLICILLIASLQFFRSVLSTTLSPTAEWTQKSDPAFLTYAISLNDSDKPVLEEVSSLLDTAPLFVPLYSLSQDFPQSELLAHALGVPSSFSDYPPEIQLDGAQLALDARNELSTPVVQAVDVGLRKLRESEIEFTTFGEKGSRQNSLSPELRACQIKIAQLDTGKIWTKTILPFEDTDTHSPLWEPMVLFAAIGDLGLVAPPSPANSTGIESLDKKLFHIAQKTLNTTPLPKGNYRILIYP